MWIAATITSQGEEPSPIQERQIPDQEKETESIIRVPWLKAEEGEIKPHQLMNKNGKKPAPIEDYPLLEN